MTSEARTPLITRTGRRTAQAGLAALLLLAVLVMGSLYALLSGINTATADLQQKRDDTTAAALRQAKEALIAWSATRASQGPGHLPCPDTDNDGNSEGAACGTPATRIGRLPWRTLGLPDLRDANGERLWYVLSGNFINQVGNPVNSDTPGQLTVAGIAPANNVIAIVFAPGPALAGQNRAGPVVPPETSPATSVCNPAADNNCRVQNYLEGENGDAANDLFVAARRCEQTDCPGGAFNDQLATLTHQELFVAVENVVEKRLARDVVPEIRAYFEAWGNVIGVPAGPARGFYPFAAPFDDLSQLPTLPTDPGRPQDRYRGFLDTTPPLRQTNGLLPVTRDTAWMTWGGPPVSCTKSGGSPLSANFSPAPGPGPTACTAGCTWDSTALTCVFTYQGGVPPVPGPEEGMDVTVTGTVLNVAKSFTLPIPGAGAPAGATLLGFSQTLAPTSGDLQVSYQVRLGYAATPTAVTLTIPTPQFQAWIDPTVTANWFVRNEWYRQVYYSVSPGFVLTPTVAAGAGGTCVVAGTPECITVTTPTATTDNNRAVLVLAGRNLPGGGRPWMVANYFEGQNASSPTFDTPAPDYVFRRELRSSVFNDRVVVVAP